MNEFLRDGCACSAVYTYHCTGCGAVRGQTSPVVIADGSGLSVAGALRCVAARETLRLPALRRQQSASRRSGHSLVLSPFGFCGSRRQWVVNPRTRVSGALAVEDNQPPCPTKAPGTRDHCRATGPRVYKSPSSPRPLLSNQLPCLQKLLEPETTAGQPAPVSAKVPRPVH